MDEKRFYGRRLRTAREFSGLGITELAKRVGLSKQSLSCYENDVNTPPYNNVILLAKELNFPYDFFCNDDVCKTVVDNVYFRSQSSVRDNKDNAFQLIRIK